MKRKRLLDLCCGAGGASVGYSRAGFEVVGVDIKAQPNYPFEFIRADLRDVLASSFIDNFDVIHASPPCFAYSPTMNFHPGAEYPDLVAVCREMLKVWREQTGGLWVMENVPGAPMPDAVTLCGSSFGLGTSDRHLRRHRLFESPLILLVPACNHYGKGTITVVGTGGNTDRQYNGRKSEREQAMGITHMTIRELTLAVPPAMTEYVGWQLLCALPS